MGCGDHDSDDLSVLFLAPQSSQDTDSEEDRVKDIATEPKTRLLRVCYYDERESGVQCPEACGSILKGDVRRLGVLVGEGCDSFDRERRHGGLRASYALR